MLRVSGRNIDLGQNLREQVEARIGAAVRRYLDGPFDGHVTVGKEGGGFRTECALRLATGATLHATGFAHDAYASFGEAADKFETRLRRYKQRLGLHSPATTTPEVMAPYRVLEAPAWQSDDKPQVEAAPTVVAETTMVLRTCSVLQAVEELDLTGAPFLVFRHGGSERINVVYRRGDGHIGWIDPPPAETP